MVTQLSEIQGLLILINGFLVFIAGWLILIGWHMTEPRPRRLAEAKVIHDIPPLLRRIQRTMEERCALSGMTVLRRGPVLPNRRTYMARGETLPLPEGVTLEAGREVALVAMPA
jgi:hypothetical protein